MIYTMMTVCAVLLTNGVETVGACKTHLLPFAKATGRGVYSPYAAPPPELTRCTGMIPATIAEIAPTLSERNERILSIECIHGDPA